MNTNVFRKIMGILLIALVVLLTLKFIKMLPAFMKVVMLAANVATIYLAYNHIIKSKNKKKNGSNS